MKTAARARAAGSSVFANDDANENRCCTAQTQDRLIDAPSVSLERQLAAVRREIRIHRQVYPIRVATGCMSARRAAYEIAAMEAVATTLVDLIEGRRL
jgi:hypothetical protein